MAASSFQTSRLQPAGDAEGGTDRRRGPRGRGPGRGGRRAGEEFGRVAQDDARKFQIPVLLLLPAEQFAESRIFTERSFGLKRLHPELLVFAAKRCVLLDQFRAGRDRIAGFIEDLVRGIGEAEQRQEQTANGNFQSRGRASWQIQNDQNKHHNYR